MDKELNKDNKVTGTEFEKVNAEKYEKSNESYEKDTWGDLGCGLYKNPILDADYSDPDVIRVGDDFYMVCSEFHYMGMPVLHSKDLVNWLIVGQVYGCLDIDRRYDEMEGYGKGSWAPAIRYHDGLFYVYFCTPDEGLYMSCAEHAEGPWSPLYEVRRTEGWEDPCPFWDDDGTAYLGHSTVGAGPIIIHKMSSDGKRLLDEGKIVYVGKIAEGTKIYKRNGYYYLVIPEGGVEEGWQTVLRSRCIYGPYERKVVLQTGLTSINGPHQGALLELDSGESWFIHFQSKGALGRVCHLQPVYWVDDWPLMGMEGEPVSVYRKPDVGKEYPATLPQSSDEFEQSKLGLQWQWNHNPADSHWSLSVRPGHLSLEALKADDIFKARNTLTQKIMGTRGVITAELDTQFMRSGQIAGLVYLGGNGEENWIGVVASDGICRIEAVTDGVRCHGPAISRCMPAVCKDGYGMSDAPMTSQTPKECDAPGSAGHSDLPCLPVNVWFKSVIDIYGETLFYFSLDGWKYFRIGGSCSLSAGYWKGTRVGLFSYNTLGCGGRADFNWFRYVMDNVGKELK